MKHVVYFETELKYHICWNWSAISEDNHLVEKKEKKREIWTQHILSSFKNTNF